MPDVKPDAQFWRDRAALVRASGMAAIAEAVVPRWFTPQFINGSPAEVETVVGMLRGVSPEGYAGCAEAIAAMDLYPLLQAVTAPTLVLSGAEDPAAPPWIGARTARLTVVRGASHFAHYEQPGPVTDALLTHFTVSDG